MTQRSQAPSIEAPQVGSTASPSSLLPWVDLKQVCVHWGPICGLRNVTFSMGAGERVAVIGANGSGKSTLLRVVHGLIEPSQGQCRVRPGLRQAMLFQRPHVLRLSAQSNMALGLWLDRAQGLSWPQAQALALQALQRVGLQGVAQQSGRTLSGGQLQRLALARAWARAPELLLLDEPTASLDPSAKREIEALMESFAQASTQVSLLFASHNLGQVKRLASRVVYVEGGEILADLSVAEFFDAQHLQSVSPQAQAFVQGERS